MNQLAGQSTLTDICSYLNEQYPESSAQSWDQVGLVVGAPTQNVQKVLLAVDPSAPVIAEAQALGVDLLIVHHPLVLKGITHFNESTPKGRVLAGLLRSNIALYTAHTNADIAHKGVNAALAATLGLINTRPLIPHGDNKSVGLGRVGSLPFATTLREFAEFVAQVLPATRAGVRISGPSQAIINTVAVCGGSGDSMFEEVRASNADVYLTSDLRHHPATESRDFQENQRPYLVDVAHFASEWPWLPWCKELLLEKFPQLDIQVSTLVSDAWTDHIAQMPEPTAYSSTLTAGEIKENHAGN